jgi:hypothetical protein
MPIMTHVPCPHNPVSEFVGDSGPHWDGIVSDARIAEFAKYLDLFIFERFLSVVHNQIYLTDHRYIMSLRHDYYDKKAGG